MQTFGKRQYDHMDLDPWERKKSRLDAPTSESASPVRKFVVFGLAIATIGAVAFAGFEILLLA